MKLLFLTLALSFVGLPLCYSMTSIDRKLLTAAVNGNLEQAKEALDNGANVNSQDVGSRGNFSWQSTPLHRAVEHDHIEITKLLVNAGANVNVQNSMGETPLHLASQRGNTEIVKLLLDTGIASVDIEDKDGWTPIDRAALLYRIEIIVLLVAAYDLKKREAQERPTKETLRKAIQSNYSGIVALLLHKGISADVADLVLAKQFGHKNIGRMLIKYLGATTGQNGISKTGISGVHSITQDIAKLIMSYTV